MHGIITAQGVTLGQVCSQFDDLIVHIPRLKAVSTIFQKEPNKPLLLSNRNLAHPLPFGDSGCSFDNGDFAKHDSITPYPIIYLVNQANNPGTTHLGEVIFHGRAGIKIVDVHTSVPRLSQR
jgi:hypothetical protein